MLQVAVLWVVNEQGEVLLAQRAHHKRQDPGVWGPAVTGKLEPGESFDEALAREVEEEIGLKPHEYQPKFLLQKDYSHPDGELRRFGIYYTSLPHATSDKLRIDANEVAGVAWFAMDDVRTKMKADPQELVPSANAVWPETFAALHQAQAL